MIQKCTFKFSRTRLGALAWPIAHSHVPCGDSGLGSVSLQQCNASAILREGQRSQVQVTMEGARAPKRRAHNKPALEKCAQTSFLAQT